MNGDSYSSRDGGRHGSSRDYPPPRGDRDDRRDRDRDRDHERRRRRSRSPDHRRSRRDPGGEADSYSSSRTHRDREREDRYMGRDRRPEREWDRDRGSTRRDARRDDDDRYAARRDREPWDDRPRGGRRDRERDFHERDRRRTPTPPPKKREPTPDLTNVIPVLERKRRLTQWDIKPPGYENVTSEQAKLSGMFPLPGAPRQQVMDPTKLQAFSNQSGGGGGGGGDRGSGGGGGGGGDRASSNSNNASLKPGSSRQSKRLVVANLLAGTTEDALQGFFNLQLNGLNVIEDSDPCTLCQTSADGTFALAEFRTPADATIALALDGISMEAEDAPSNGAGGPSGLAISRPKDYIVPAVPDESGYEPGVVSSVVLDTPNKISVANIPPYLKEDQVSELLLSFGELKAFVLVKDQGTEESRGIAFCEYVDPSTTDIAIQGLNGMELGDRKLRVKKASIGITQISSVEMGVNAMSMLAGTTSTESDISPVLQLLNMVTPEELMDPDDYEEICDDVREECSKFGTIVELKVPRPVGGSRQSAGVGKIFVKFDSNESCTKALKALAGRKFADRTVITTYFPVENFEVNAW